MWNHLDSNIFTKDIIQRELIPPLIAVVTPIISISCQQTELQYRLVTWHSKYNEMSRAKCNRAIWSAET